MGIQAAFIDLGSLNWRQRLFPRLAIRHGPISVRMSDGEEIDHIERVEQLKNSGIRTDKNEPLPFRRRKGRRKIREGKEHQLAGKRAVHRQAFRQIDDELTDPSGLHTFNGLHKPRRLFGSRATDHLEKGDRRLLQHKQAISLRRTHTGNVQALVTNVKSWDRQLSSSHFKYTRYALTEMSLIAYSKFDVPDPWGQPRQAVIAQEFVVSRK